MTAKMIKISKLNIEFRLLSSNTFRIQVEEGCFGSCLLCVACIVKEGQCKSLDLCGLNLCCICLGHEQMTAKMMKISKLNIEFRLLSSNTFRIQVEEGCFGSCLLCVACIVKEGQCKSLDLCGLNLCCICLGHEQMTAKMIKISKLNIEFRPLSSNTFRIQVEEGCFGSCLLCVACIVKEG